MASEIAQLDCRQETEEVEESEKGNWDVLPPELLNLIFDLLPVADLLFCSVVSKTWKKASRDVLKRSRECYAHIKNFPQDLHDLIDKIGSTDLMQMVNGLHIQIDPKAKNKKSVSSLFESSNLCQVVGSPNVNNLKSTETRQKLINVALSGQIRFLTLDMEDGWEQNLSADDVLLLRELISDTSDSLHKLVVWQDKCCELMSSCEKEFSKLKVAEVQYEEILEESFLKKFLTAFAPNLEEITGWMLLVAVNSQGSQYMLKRSKNLLIYHNKMIPQVYMEDYRCISGLHDLELRVSHCDSLGDDNILFSMLLKSLNSLAELYMYTLEFYKLFKTSAQLKFPNLRLLSLTANLNMPVGDEITILKQLSLPKLCPNLEQLELSIDTKDDTEDVYNEEDWTPAALPYGADQSYMPLDIALKYRGEHYSHEYFEFLNGIYPKINNVRMLNWKLGDAIDEMSSIFLDIPSLEYLEINPNYDCPDALDFQMDALLCGISLEEVEFQFNSSTWTNTAEFKPCIVPIRPSLFNAKNLKELKITGEGPGPFVIRSWVIQLTENLPARHARSLKVTFLGRVDLFHRLNRLRAFTTLFCPRCSKHCDNSVH